MDVTDFLSKAENITGTIKIVNAGDYTDVKEYSGDDINTVIAEYGIAYVFSFKITPDGITIYCE